MAGLLDWRMELDWAAPGNSATCGQLAQQIAGDRTLITNLQKQLASASSTTKPQILEQIFDAESDMEKAEAAQRNNGCATLSRTLNAKIPIQEKDQWCWVAAGSGITSFYDNTAYSQCSVVTMVFKIIHPGFNLDCCNPQSKVTPDCNGQSGVDQALSYPKRHFLKDTGLLDFDEIMEQIDSGCPVATEIVWKDGVGAHFVVITGYTLTAATNPQQMVFVQDPGDGYSAWYTLSDFSTGYDSGAGYWVGSTLSTPGVNQP
jgi:hypothetical protein